jgi:hypothetical protein
MSWFVVSVHDVSPATFMASRWWVRELEQRGVAATLLVIPGPYRGQRLEPTSATAGWLRERSAAGHEIAQHGWEHHGVGPVRGPSSAAARVVSRGCAEFAGLSNKEARRRILSGFGVLSSCDLVPWGFVPPAGLASAGTVDALAALGYRYVSTTMAVIDLWTKRRLRCVSRCHRPGAVGQGIGRAVVRHAAATAAAGRPVRLALHPADLEWRGLRRDALTTIDRMLEHGARSSTYLGLFDPRPGDGSVRVGA